MGSTVTLRQSRTLLLANGEGGLSVRPLLRLLASRQGRSHRTLLVTTGTLVVPRRAWLPFLPIVDVVLMYIMLKLCITRINTFI